METRNVKISIENAIRWFNGTNSELKELAVQTYPELTKKELPKRWEELEKINGYYVNSDSRIFGTYINRPAIKENRIVFATDEQAEASIATAMYSQLLQAYKEVSIEQFIEIAKEYEPKVRTILELFFAENATAAFYLGLISQLRKEYRNGWIPDWANREQVKYCIEFYNDEINTYIYKIIARFLSFQDEETRDLFLENFKELIEKAKPLLS